MNDADVDDVAIDLNYPSENQDQKQKITDRMMTWRVNNGQGEHSGPPKYDSGEILPNHMHYPTHSRTVFSACPLSIQKVPILLKIVTLVPVSLVIFRYPVNFPGNYQQFLLITVRTLGLIQGGGFLVDLEMSNGKKGLTDGG